jgi:hypothetical protein
MRAAAHRAHELGNDREKPIPVIKGRSSCTVATLASKFSFRLQAGEALILVGGAELVQLPPLLGRSTMGMRFPGAC